MDIINIPDAKACPPSCKELHTQVLVLGGGLPGVVAAIQAAEMGQQVILVEHRLTLGGNCGPEIGVHPSDAHRFHTYMVSTGIVGRLIEDAAFYHAKTDSNDHHYNVSMRWDTVMSKALERAGVTVLRGHYAHTPYMKDNKIVAVLCEDTMSYHQVLIHVDGYVIDDTGDGNISERAGAEYHMGREAKSEYNESLAPDKADGITMGHSLVTLIRETGQNSPFYPDPDTPPFFKGYGGDGPFFAPEGASLLFWFPTETGGEINTVEDNDKIYRRLRGHLDSAWDRVKNYWAEERSQSWEMVWCSAQMGKRESRRFLGDYVLNQNDLENARKFDDAIAVGGFAFDIHYPNPENVEYVKVVYHRIPPVYTIPYRSIYSKDIDNLFFASRLLSVSHLAHGSVRLQRTLATIGQAAGMAAALCGKYGITSRQLYTENHVEELQQLLLKWDATIPNRSNTDKKDLAKSAKVSASSELGWEIPGEKHFEKLRTGGGVELWDFTDRLDVCEILLRNPTDGSISVRCELEHFVPDHIWQAHGERTFFDYYPHHNEVEWGSEHGRRFYKSVKSVDVTVPAHFEGYVSIPFDAPIASKNPMTDDDRMAVTLYPAGEVLEIARGAGPLPMLRSIHGISENGEQYDVGPESTFAVIYPTPLCGEASQVLNGQNRRFSENPRNMWQPKALPAELVLFWDKPITAGEVHITFDTLERAAIEMPYESNHRVSGQCVKDFTVTLFSGDRGVYTVKKNNWHNRLAVLSFPETAFDRLVLTVESIWDSDRTPGVYEIRVY